MYNPVDTYPLSVERQAARMPVVLIMTDGLRPDAITPERTPHLWNFAQRGAHTFAAQSVVPSVTLPCHTSIFHSVPPSRHGITDNDYHPQVRPITGLVDQLNTHNQKCAYIYNWEQLRDLNRPGSLYYSYFINTGYQLDGDDPLVDVAVPILAESRYPFTFFYFSTVDLAGHVYGWMSDGYLAQAAHVDGLIGRLLAAIPPETVTIIHSDHGGHERTHGTEMPEDMLIPYMIGGKGVRPGYVIQRPVSLLDTAPTVAHLLNVPPVREWEGTPITEAFEASGS